MHGNRYHLTVVHGQPGNFEKNLAIVDKLGDLAKAKDVTPVQMILAWEMAQWEVSNLP